MIYTLITKKNEDDITHQKNRKLKNIKKIVLLILVIIIALSSCVSKKKFQNEQKTVKYLRVDSINTHINLNTCILKVSDLEKDKSEIQKSLKNLSSSSESTIADSKLTIAEQAKRLKDLQTLIQSQKDVLLKLKRTVADALINFKPDELSVELKDGRLYVSLQEKLLFKSGSAVVDPKGKEALLKLASVLNTT